MPREPLGDAPGRGVEQSRRARAPLRRSSGRARLRSRLRSRFPHGAPRVPMCRVNVLVARRDANSQLAGVLVRRRRSVADLAERSKTAGRRQVRVVLEEAAPTGVARAARAQRAGSARRGRIGDELPSAGFANAGARRGSRRACAPELLVTADRACAVPQARVDRPHARTRRRRRARARADESTRSRCARAARRSGVTLDAERPATPTPPRDQPRGVADVGCRCPTTGPAELRRDLRRRAGRTRVVRAIEGQLVRERRSSSDLRRA